MTARTRRAQQHQHQNQHQQRRDGDDGAVMMFCVVVVVVAAADVVPFAARVSTRFVFVSDKSERGGAQSVVLINNT